MRTAFVLIAALALLTCKSGAPARQKQSVAAPWSATEARDAAAAYLVRHLDASGRFDYLRGEGTSKTKYNLLRHAGAIYALLGYIAQKDSPEAKAAILRASRYLKSRYLRAPKGHPELLAAFSMPAEEGVRAGTAKLGGAGLTLLALCGSYQLDSSVVSVGELQALGRFILFMQKEDGSFHSKFIEDSGFDPEFHSLYYPGEAMLALTQLYEIDKDVRWLEAGLRTARQLVTSRADVARPPADHWMMLAGSPLLRLHEEVQSPAIAEEDLREHLGRLGRLMMDDQARHKQSATPSEIGRFERGSRSTPSSTRLEGLLALLQIQRSVDQVEPGLPEAIAQGLAFLRRCQLKSQDADRGGMPRSCAHNAGQDKRDLEIRIDYVQHYLSALLSAQELGLL
jgi:hypothetical protein